LKPENSETNNNNLNLTGVSCCNIC
jgi:hypothetical protein